MLTKVRKRDGRVVDFDENKIQEAILRAFKQVDGEITSYAQQKAASIAAHIKSQFNDQEIKSIEDIQDQVELGLMSCKRKDVARAYITYRNQRNRERERNLKIFQIVKEKLSASNVQNQNANLDEYSFGGRRGEADSEINKYLALNEYISPKHVENHLNNRIYIHDLDSYVVGMHNCLSIPFDKLLAEGFTTRQTDVRPAGGINTAVQLIAVIFQLQSLQQFGGVSATHLDWTLVPYVRKSFAKHYKDGLRYLENIESTEIDYEIEFMLNNSTDYSIEDLEYKAYSSKAYQYALDMTTKELQQAVEGLYHNLNTLQSRSGCQLPFTSINYGTCTLPEGRMVIKTLLEKSIEGVGKLHKTSIFPCGIFQLGEGINRKPGDPNYDLFQLALKSTATRLYPNYANIDWSGNTGYDKKDPKTYFSTMGALAGHEHLYIKMGDNPPLDISIKDLYQYIKQAQAIKGRPAQLHFPQDRLNIPGVGKYNYQPFNDTRLSNSGVYKITYLPEDVTYIGSSSNIQQRWREHRRIIRCTGGVEGSICFSDPNVAHYKFEVIEYCDNYKAKEAQYIETVPNVNLRGVSSAFYKNAHITRGNCQNRPIFRHRKQVAQDLIDVSNLDIKVYDIGNKWTKIRHIFKNDKTNTPLMMEISYTEGRKIYAISCTEDHPLWTGKTFTQAGDLHIGDSLYRADGLELPIVAIKWYQKPVDSYDIGTESGTFIGSDIQMHNCRTANGFDINAEPGTNPQTKDGRGNICPVTIILPTLAMEAKQQNPDAPIETFLELLKEALEDSKDCLIERFEWICNQSPESARFMYENGTLLGYKPEEGIQSALKHGTLAVGQLGLAEALQILTGCDHTDPRGMEVAKQIEQLFKDICQQYKQRYKLNFGVYMTPAETLCHTAMTKFKARYGIIPEVSDREYFTNSMHVPVWKDISPFDKIDIESQLTGYSSAGCITYVELDGGVKHNIPALETLVNYAMDHDIPYFAINVPNDTCMSCGFTGEFNDCCPICGSPDIQQLRRVTGYLTGNYKTAFNKGKQAEVEDRIKHGKGQIE